MKNTVIVVDYGMGNLHSVKKKLNRMGVVSEISNSMTDIANADKLILPGVGHFAKAMQNIDSLGLRKALDDFAIIKKKPILGICLGMQIMLKYSEEGNCSGLGWVDGSVVRFRISDFKNNKVPHMGWNTVSPSRTEDLWNNINDEDEFYFVHSYHAICNQKEDVAGETEYAYSFCSAIRKGNIIGVQFHPEKSHSAGEKLLANFLSL